MKNILLILSLFLISCDKKIERNDPFRNRIPYNIKLNGPLVLGGNVADQFQVSPDGLKVVYIADQDSDGRNELFVVDVLGNNNLKLSPEVGGRNVLDFKISKDSQYVAYRSNHNSANRYDLFVVKTDGTEFVQINNSLPSDTHSLPRTYEWLSDNKILFISDESHTAGDSRLYINEKNGLSRLELSTGSYIAPVFKISPNESRIVYRQDFRSGGNPTVRSVTPDKSADNLLTPVYNVVMMPSVAADEMIISDDSSKVVYLANHDTESVKEIFSINIDGSGTRFRVSGTQVLNGGVLSGDKFKFSGSRVVYVAEQDVDGIGELYVSNIDGTSNAKISGTYNGTNGVESFKVAGNKIIYKADQSTSGVYELYRANISGGSVRLHSALSGGQSVSQYEIAPNNSRVVFSHDGEGQYNLYSNTLDNTSLIKINPTITGGSGVFDTVANPAVKNFIISPDSSRVVTRASIDSADYKLYSASLDGSNFKQVSEDGNVSIASNIFAYTFFVLPNSEYIVYRFGTPVELYLGLIKD